MSERRRMMMENLPYRKIEYLQSSGTQYIDTGIYGSMDLDFDVYFEPLELTSSRGSGAGTIFGSRASWNAKAYQLTTFNNNASRKGHLLVAANYGWSDSRTPSMGMTTGSKNHITKNGLSVTCADGVVSTLTNQSFTTVDTIRIFASYNEGRIDEHIKARIYSLSFSKNGVKVRDFIPVRVGNVGYMYDKVSGELFGNAGTGDFILGPDIN